LTILNAASRNALIVSAREDEMSFNPSESRAVRITQHGGLGLAWLAGWLFTIGYLHQGFWQGLLGLFVWPYFIGAALAPG
jgi:hypothetical protein